MATKLTLLKTLALLTIVVCFGQATAANVRFMQDSALAAMTAEDVDVLQNAARNALDYTEDGDPRRWENSETGAKGVLTPLSSFEQDGSFCRRLEMFAEVKEVSGRSVFVFCRQPDGTWRVPASSSGKTTEKK